MFKKQVVVVSLLLMPVFSFSMDASFNGKAFLDKERKQMVYKENHKVLFEGKKIVKSETIYRDPKTNKKIAILKNNYNQHRFMPQFEFEDLRTGYWEKVTYEGDKLKVEYKENKSSELKSQSFNKADDVSTSQGLNQRIAANLLKLSKGEEVVTNFILPSRMTDIKMLLSGKPGEGEKVYVTIKVKNFLLRIFAPELKLTYDKSNSRLLNYYGNSNILTSNGEKQTVYIDYEYADSAVLSEK